MVQVLTDVWYALFQGVSCILSPLGEHKCPIHFLTSAVDWKALPRI